MDRQVHESELSADAMDRGQYRHFMLKEIFEQPAVLAETLEGRVEDGEVVAKALGGKAQELIEAARAVHIIACGTSYHAGLVARQWIERLAQIPCNVEVASEYRYREVVVPPQTLFLTISQSGETADSLAALQLAKTRDYIGSMVICNVAESSLVRESDCALFTRAGPEIGVASTKAFTSQVVALTLFALHLGSQRGLDPETMRQYLDALTALPAQVQQILNRGNEIRALASRLVDHDNFLYLGRGYSFPVALEGALKLKEISYIHAEGFSAAEMKHGPIALIDEDMPVVVVAPRDASYPKVLSNMQEVKARGGHVIAISSEPNGLVKISDELFAVPHTLDALLPILTSVPLQLLAYHIGVMRGCDVDKPRNLAKSVTVE